jgi:hypothetical protein
VDAFKAEEAKMMMRSFAPVAAAVFAAAISHGDPALAQPSAGEHLGEVHFPISCSGSAQQQFDRALAMVHSFFYPETVKAFTALANQEPTCAMAFWGIAISQRPNPLIVPLPPELLKAGWDAIEKARAAATKTPRERDWIEALALYYKDYAGTDQRTRTLAYEAAMARLSARYPDDAEAAIFYALALNEAADLNDKTYSRQFKAVGILQALESTHPNHPGITHYIIHSYDFAAICADGIPAAERYAEIAPSAPHALHMPSHIFSMTGKWNEVIRSNLASDASQKAYTLRLNPQAGTIQADNPARYHQLDFLTVAYLQLGQDRRAKEIVDMRNSVGVLTPNFRYTAHTAFAAIPVRYALDRSAWAEAAALPVMKTPYAQAEAISWFGRALGAARSRDAAAARADVESLRHLREKLLEEKEAYWADQADIQIKAAEAWIALAEGRAEEARAQMHMAADMEDRSEKHIAMENRLSPMRELLGELLLETGEPAGALEAFEASLKSAPNRYRSLAGAAKAALALGDKSKARSYYASLVAFAREADGERPDLVAARRFLAN